MHRSNGDRFEYEDGLASRRATFRLLGGALLAAGGATLAACGAGAGAAGVGMKLPPYAYSSRVVLTGYRFAADHPEALVYLPCYCGCGQTNGHENLRDCFVSAAGAFDPHAAGCNVCIDEALDAKRLSEQGRSRGEIRQAIDATYAGSGKPTNTPPV